VINKALAAHNSWRDGCDSWVMTEQDGLHVIGPCRCSSVSTFASIWVIPELASRALDIDPDQMSGTFAAW
jgi:hypothetical protein